MEYKYLIPNVRAEEYSELKKQESTIITSVKSSFNKYFKQKTEKISISFKYNPKRNIMAMFIGRRDAKQIVLDNMGLSEEEKMVVKLTHQRLEERLDEMRLIQEEWVDNLQN